MDRGRRLARRLFGRDLLPELKSSYSPWRDPVCLGSWALYALNRGFLEARWGDSWPFLREHLNDSLLVPAALPLLLWARWKLRLRASDGPPTWKEIWFWTALWALLFEALGPRFLGHSVGDWRDVAAYFAGAMLAGTVWQRAFCGRSAAEETEKDGSL